MRIYRCFLYLVNYARTKPEIALRALPTLVQVWEAMSMGKE
jgi:vesicle coat complex subunit